MAGIACYRISESIVAFECNIDIYNIGRHFHRAPQNRLPRDVPTFRSNDFPSPGSSTVTSQLLSIASYIIGRHAYISEIFTDIGSSDHPIYNHQLYLNMQANRSNLYQAESTLLRPGSKVVRVLILHPGPHEGAISCSLSVVSLDDEPAPNYEALSYVWGDETVTETVTVDAMEVHATVNLIVALRRIRHGDRNTVLWVDAICINQNNMEEKASQVGMMGDIYLSCSQVII